MLYRVKYLLANNGGQVSTGPHFFEEVDAQAHCEQFFAATGSVIQCWVYKGKEKLRMLGRPRRVAENWFGHWDCWG